MDREDGTTLSIRIQSWQVGSGPLPWWVVDQEPCPPNGDKTHVAIRSAHVDVRASMGDYIIRGLGKHLTVMSEEDFKGLFQANSPVDMCGFARTNPAVRPAL